MKKTITVYLPEEVFKKLDKYGYDYKRNLRYQLLDVYQRIIKGESYNNKEDE